ncbi:unnamed protein product [Brassica oleracea var. botrytis]
MVKTQAEGKAKAKRGRPFKNLNISEASTASSSSTAKKPIRKGMVMANGRLARHIRLAIRRSKHDKLQQQGKLKTYRYFATLPTECNKNY